MAAKNKSTRRSDTVSITTMIDLVRSIMYGGENGLILIEYHK